ncbi:MAG: hypothetical protein C5B49_00460 [Bdellovibrio sp.]|nr:MAG: hypothetical protein C5B49_00460 [Bdellovibrio sp.]
MFIRKFARSAVGSIVIVSLALLSPRAAFAQHGPDTSPMAAPPPTLPTALTTRLAVEAVVDLFHFSIIPLAAEPSNQFEQPQLTAAMKKLNDQAEKKLLALVTERQEGREPRLMSVPSDQILSLLLPKEWVSFVDRVPIAGVDILSDGLVKNEKIYWGRPLNIGRYTGFFLGLNVVKRPNVAVSKASSVGGVMMGGPYMDHSYEISTGQARIVLGPFFKLSPTRLNHLMDRLEPLASTIKAEWVSWNPELDEHGEELVDEQAGRGPREMEFLVLQVSAYPQQKGAKKQNGKLNPAELNSYSVKFVTHLIDRLQGRWLDRRESSAPVLFCDEVHSFGRGT